MTVYLTLDEVLHIHSELIRAFGGADGIRDRGLIESALLRPQTGYYADLIEETAAMWESLAMNHGFVDGNKRVAYACVELFLGLNDHVVVADNDDIIAFIYHHLEAGTFTKDVLDAWLREVVAAM
ncbi:type II toxin-antitoxin system death-on-curing family toxin [Devosia nitrariae]|uniref:Death-on-curing protein n=1 Tax=Devosia nitrariae TaxID=2071872 RepID=A0ABQ5W045_9HYPH|nr:type II toxin-antitoxin system death-on-curing family toxin [Devosia nitrariae]GLQ53398.1 death-on-curing protein [Devosia nitrariae]